MDDLQTPQKLNDLAKWFFEHKNEISDTDKRTKFLEDAFTNFVWILTYVLEDLQHIHGAKQTRLILPERARLYASPPKS